MLYAVLQVLVLWDFHVVWRLERWQAEAGAHLREWLAALGEAEALAALATLAHDNPGWTLPELREGGPALVTATALGHPLIAPAHRVANDVAVGPASTVLLVTGSNMSGKSTLLRAIGLNVVLAQAGGPACAAAMRLPILAPWTSMRVQDSIEIGVSLFMAELRRLRQIVDSARAAASQGRGARPVLYLLDEVLHGTNTAERRIAVRTVVGQLLRLGAIGAITSHDLALAEEGPLARAARPVHFRESFAETPEGPRMTFDYLLRPGLATSANALALLRMLGLGDDGGSDGA
jgi:DNA mismatch repair ATPase MutS